jgi:hypothetical protein
MAVVYLAVDTQLDRRVALKVPSVHCGNEKATLDRFNREAHVAARFQHPHVCPIYDFGVCDGVPYIAMAFIDGILLTDLVAASGPLPDRIAALIVRKVALAMDAVHSTGIVHRDLKTSNIMVDSRKEPILLDFGLARILNNTTRHTMQGVVIGTLAYMAPEQVADANEAGGTGSDIYSLGVVLYELLTGRVPYEGTFAAVVAKILTQSPRPPSEYCPTLCQKMEMICLKAMARDPKERYDSMSAFAAALSTWLHELHGASRGASAALPVSETPQKPGARGKDNAALPDAAVVASPAAVLAAETLKMLAAGTVEEQVYRLQDQKIVRNVKRRKQRQESKPWIDVPDQCVPFIPVMAAVLGLAVILFSEDTSLVKSILFIVGLSIWLGAKWSIYEIGKARGASARAILLIPVYSTIVAVRDLKRSVIPFSLSLFGFLVMMAGAPMVFHNADALVDRFFGRATPSYSQPGVAAPKLQIPAESRR